MMSYLVHFLIFLALQDGTNIISRAKLSSSFTFQTDQICLPLGAHALEMEKGISLILPPQARKGKWPLSTYSIRHCTKSFAGVPFPNNSEIGFIIATLENKFQEIMPYSHPSEHRTSSSHWLELVSRIVPGFNPLQSTSLKIYFFKFQINVFS